MSCPPDTLCIRYSHSIVIVIIFIIAGFYIYTKCNKAKDDNTSLKIQMDEKINELSKKIESNKQIQQIQEKNDLYEDIRSKLNETPQNNDIFEEPSKKIDGVRVNIATRGPTPKITQIGILSKMGHTNTTGPGSDAEAHILPLLGRKTYNRSSKWVYYTATDKYNQVRIPISHNGRNCGGEYGCDEIMDGDTITIPELNGTFTAKIYENTALHYIPYIN